MTYIKDIFARANIRSVVDYLLFGSGPDFDNKDYEERLDEPYEQFEKAVLKFDKNQNSEILDLSNALTSETAKVYAEIGLQLGIMLMKDVMYNAGSVGQSDLQLIGKQTDLFESSKSILEELYKERRNGI